MRIDDGQLAILFCTLDYFPNATGGAEHQAQLQAEMLSQRGHRVTVVCPGARRAPGEAINGVAVRRLAFVDRRPFRKASYYLALSLFLLRHARKFQIIHVHLANVQADVVVSVSRLLGRPVFVKCASGGSNGEITRGKRHFGKVTRWYGLRRAARVQALSAEIEAELASVGTPRERILRIPNGIDLGRFAPPSTAAKRDARRMLGLPMNKFLVLFAGRFASYKGLGDLRAAWDEVATGEALLVLVGSPAVDHPVDVRPAPGRIVMPGWTRDVRPYLLACDLFVHPSHTDGMSNSLLEAMAAGIPIIATRLGATVDLLSDGKDAVLVEPLRPGALAKKIDEVASDPELRQRLAEGSSSRIQEFGVGGVVSQIEDAYRSILAEC